MQRSLPASTVISAYFLTNGPHLRQSARQTDVSTGKRTPPHRLSPHISSYIQWLAGRLPSRESPINPGKCLDNRREIPGEILGKYSETGLRQCGAIRSPRPPPGLHPVSPLPRGPPRIGPPREGWSETSGGHLAEVENGKPASSTQLTHSGGVVSVELSKWQSPGAVREPGCEQEPQISDNPPVRCRRERLRAK
jgi:hypothetical protein